MRRLALIRYLYGLGEAQSRGPQPAAGLALLSLHDAIEFFLQLACERHQIGDGKTSFTEYWKLLEKAGVTLRYGGTMRRLNAARVNLKHHGVMISIADMEAFRSATTNFFQDSSPKTFGIEFEQISLVELVVGKQPRELLQRALARLNEQNHQLALAACAEAFVHVRRAYDELWRVTTQSHRPASLRARAAPKGQSHFELRDLGANTAIRKSIEGIEGDLKRSVDLIAEAVEMIGYGLDFKAYMTFKAHLPVVHELIGGKLTIDWMGPATEDRVIVEDCINFVVDTAIRLGV